MAYSWNVPLLLLQQDWNQRELINKLFSFPLYSNKGEKSWWISYGIFFHCFPWHSMQMKGLKAKYYILFTCRNRIQKEKILKTRHKANGQSRIWTQIFWIPEHTVFYLTTSHLEERNTTLSNWWLMDHLNSSYRHILFWTFDCNPATLIFCSQFAVYSLQQISTCIVECFAHSYPGVLVSASLKAEVRWAARTCTRQMWLSKNSLSNICISSWSLDQQMHPVPILWGYMILAHKGLRQNRHAVWQGMYMKCQIVIL